MKYLACGLALLMLFASCLASAADRLFPTDHVDVGELDAYLVLQRYDINTDAQGAPFTLEREVTVEQLSLRTGITSRFHAGISLPHHSTDKTTLKAGSASFLLDEDKGFKNIDLWLSHQLRDGSTPDGMALLGTLTAHTNTGGDAYEGLGADLTAGWPHREGWRPYGGMSYRYCLDSDDKSGMSIGGGAFRRVSDLVTLKPSAYFRHYLSAGRADASDNYGLSLQFLFAVAQNATVIPGIHVDHYGAQHYDPPSISFEGTTAVRFSLVANMLFGAKVP